MDDQLWKLAPPIAQHLGHQRVIELDFIRGIHQRQALNFLAGHLGTALGVSVRLTSIWMDKFVWASWVDDTGRQVGGRELADMGIVVRRRHAGTIAKWMWLVQAKRTGALAEAYKASQRSSTWYELDMLHRMPPFYLWNGYPAKHGTQASIGPFDLQKDFGVLQPRQPAVAPWGPCAHVPWTFLDFDADITAAQSANKNGYPAIAGRWLGDGQGQSNSWAEDWRSGGGFGSPSFASYVGCLEAIALGVPIQWKCPPHQGRHITGRSPSFVPGAPIDKASYPQWWELYRALLLRSHGATSGHAQSPGNEPGSVTQYSRFAGLMSVNVTRAALRARGAPFRGPAHKFASVGPIGTVGGRKMPSDGVEVEWSVGNIWSYEDLESLEGFDAALDDGTIDEGGIPPPSDGEPPSDDGFEGSPGVGMWLFVDVIDPPTGDRWPRG